MYAARADFAARMGDLFAAIYDSPADADEDLSDAQAEIDGCIGTRYLVPVTAPAAGPLLKSWTLTLAEERAYARSAGSTYSDKVKERVAQVRKYLEMVRTGEFVLPGAAENNSAGGGGISLIAGDPPIFDRDGMEGY